MTKVVALSLRPPGSPAPIPQDALQALAGEGLAGDRHADPRSPRQVLIAGATAYEELGLPPFALRENLLLGLDTQELQSGMLLRVGADAILRLSFQCEACGALDVQRPGLARTIRGRRGVLARVVQGGPIRVGDPVTLLDQRLPALPEDWRERVVQVLASLPPGMVVEYADLARFAGIQSSYCRAFPRLLASRGLPGRAVPARSNPAAPRWDGAGLFD
ncbi:MOSC domain-containing protein [Massilia sp. IC2-477]|uniref:MOSC domain-containing protein n=1 Tax=Massilia sp. IC2-477 TaxID=2887198 RepID=UPI001D1282A5|nr:MOSC domain-containing protein [Massilia sp. IC2-477]MCC2955672.1 MOSC domain-containing protein [Massilia sp. IC2-477]